MQETQVNKMKRKMQKELKKKVDAAKKEAKVAAKGDSGEHIKIANKKLEELYATAEYRNNSDFLLKRYSRLGAGEKLWVMIVVPVIAALLVPETFASVINSVAAKPMEIAGEIDSLYVYIWAMPGRAQALFWMAVVFAILAGIMAVALIARLAWALFKAFCRSPEETIRDNEAKIIERLLVEKGIFIK